MSRSDYYEVLADIVKEKPQPQQRAGESSQGCTFGYFYRYNEWVIHRHSTDGEVKEGVFRPSFGLKHGPVFDRLPDGLQWIDRQ